jgi:hypothetical protein
MNKDIIFYSNYCNYSKEVLTEISKSPLNDKMTYICVDDRNINLPSFVQAVPTIYLIKEQKVIVDEGITTWIKSKTQPQQSQELGSYFGSGDSFSSSFSNLDDTPDTSHTSEFTYLDAPVESINTPQESADSNKNMSNSYEQLEMQRKQEFSGAQRI